MQLGPPGSLSPRQCPELLVVVAHPGHPPIRSSAGGAISTPTDHAAATMRSIADASTSKCLACFVIVVCSRWIVSSTSPSVYSTTILAIPVLTIVPLPSRLGGFDECSRRSLIARELLRTIARLLGVPQGCRSRLLATLTRSAIHASLPCASNV